MIFHIYEKQEKLKKSDWIIDFNEIISSIYKFLILTKLDFPKKDSELLSSALTC